MPFIALNSTLLTVQTVTDMNFQFHLQGTPIETKEAAALLTATGVDTSEGLRIDLEKFLDMRKINSRTLFDLSVQQESRELANLAWRISVGKTDTPAKISSPRGASLSRPSAFKEDTLSLEDLIDKINRSDAYWAAGVAMIISDMHQEEWTTLRKIATAFVNECWEQRSLPNKSMAYRGFVLRDNGKLQPYEYAKGVNRKETFHVSPMYIGLREGLIFCQKHNLVEVRSAVSVGSQDDEKNAKAPEIRRMFYKLRASGRGLALRELWSDCDDFAKLLFQKRLVG